MKTVDVSASKEHRLTQSVTSTKLDVIGSITVLQYPITVFDQHNISGEGALTPEGENEALCQNTHATTLLLLNATQSDSVLAPQQSSSGSTTCFSRKQNLATMFKICEAPA